MDSSDVSHINTLARFVSNDMEDASFNLLEHGSVDCLVLCGSAILHCAESVFKAIQSRQVAKTVVICGGIGHSTVLLYEAVDAHPQYKVLSSEIRGLPESQILYRIGKDFFDLEASAEKHHITVFVEDKSTNCGANAIETKKLLEAKSIPQPGLIAIVQDPTMSLRTKASFEKIYAGSSIPSFITCPTFVPLVQLEEDEVCYDTQIEKSGLWTLPRFIDLLLGEIPRMRDDEHGYGPQGKGFIAHVDVPQDVELAWSRLNAKVSTDRAF